jgi:hypothetical protein
LLLHWAGSFVDSWALEPKLLQYMLMLLLMLLLLLLLLCVLLLLLQSLPPHIGDDIVVETN